MKRAFIFLVAVVSLSALSYNLIGQNNDRPGNDNNQTEKEVPGVNGNNGNDPNNGNKGNPNNGNSNNKPDGTGHNE